MKIKELKTRIKNKDLNLDTKLIISHLILFFLTLASFHYSIKYLNLINNEISFRRYIKNKAYLDFKLENIQQLENKTLPKLNPKPEKVNVSYFYIIILMIQLIIILNNLYYIMKKLEMI